MYQMTIHHNFEYNQANHQLEELKEELNNFLLSSYQENKEENAQRAYELIQDVVYSAIRRETFKLHWMPGGSATWHSEICKYVANWIELEHQLGMLTSDFFTDLD